MIAAWSVVADEYYHYDMKIDELGYPRALCLIRTIEGRGRIQTEEGEILLSEKEFILLKRRDIRYYSAAAKLWAYYWVDFLWVEKEPVGIGHKRFAPFEEKERLLFEELLQVGRSYPEELRYINGIFIHYFYYLRFKDRPVEENARQPILMEEICSYIEQKIYAKLSVQEVADFFQISTGGCIRFFSNPAGWLPSNISAAGKSKRLSRFCAPYQFPLPISRALLGYDSAYHFSAAFKKLVGCPPSVFRKQCAKAAPPHEADQIDKIEVKGSEYGKHRFYLSK